MRHLLMHSLALKLLLALMAGLFTPYVFAQPLHPMTTTQASETIVRAFLQTVRAGKDPDAASQYLAGKVLAHQLNAENMKSSLPPEAVALNQPGRFPARHASKD